MRSNTHSGRGDTGFTLVELLVVMGIIAVLISILLPALSRAREHAINIQCMSNMRQMGQMLSIYANDQKDYPWYSYPGWPPGGWDPAARVSDNFGGRWWSATALKGDIMRIAMYPWLKQKGYMSTYEIGFCPKLWQQRSFKYVTASDPAYRVADYADPGCWCYLAPLQLEQAVPLSGNPNEVPPFGFTSNWDPWTVETYMKHNAGEYIYMGSGTMQGELVLQSVLPSQLVDQFSTGTNMHDWSGVHVSGPSAMDNYARVLREWAGQRLPLMSEGGVGAPGSNMVTAPHFAIRARAWNDASTNIGKGNVLFNDGSVETFSFGH